MSDSQDGNDSQPIANAASETRTQQVAANGGNAAPSLPNNNGSVTAPVIEPPSMLEVPVTTDNPISEKFEQLKSPRENATAAARTHFETKKSNSGVYEKKSSGSFSFKSVSGVFERRPSNLPPSLPDHPITPNVKSARDEDPMVEVSTQNAHAVPWEQVMYLLKADAIKGLTSAEAKLRLTTFGSNKLAESPPEPFWHKIFRHINSILIYILVIAAIIAGGFQEWAEFGLILGVVAINVTLGLVQEGKAERATAALKSMLSSKATVIRDGNRMEIPADEVVPGDLVFIESGNKVPADIRLVELSHLAIQEAMLTGESLPVNKKTQTLALKLGLGDRKNMAFSATNCVKGQGKGIVVATGDETEIGKINSSVAEVKEEKTQLIKQVDAFGVWIGLMIIPIAIASFLLAFFSPGAHNRDVSNAFIEAVAIAVAIIPEGLPAIITIALSLGTAHMAAHNAIVKALPSVETLGSVMVICSDKTGTLTKNEMTVVAARTLDHLYKVSNIGYDPAGGKVIAEGITDESIQTLVDISMSEMIKGAVLCNDSRLERATVKNKPTVLPVGDPTEVALCTLGEKAQMTAEQTRAAMPRIGVIPFESEHKFMCTFHAHPQDQTKVIVYAKGAPDRLVSKCSLQMNSQGELVPVSVEFWQQQAAELSGRGLRCLAICTYTMDVVMTADALMKGPAFVSQASEPFMIFLGLTAIMDPPREECIHAIKEAHNAGVVVKMITGDHPGTAKAIGEQLGIVDKEHELVMTGPELDTLSMEELRKIVLSCNVYARASPENKISIVRALQAEQQVCSMTGDGVNDAPALRAADIGVAMGITGTDVSKDAAKMILTDDNFATILVAVKEGRRVWDNLRKLLVFNMPASFAQGGVVFFALCLQWQTVPLSAIQILYVNMITACTLGIMLVVEPAEADIMKRPPRKPSSKLLGLFFYWRSFFVATVFIFFVLGSVAWINVIASPTTVTTTTNSTIDGILYINTTTSVVREAPVGLQHSIALNTLVFCETTYAFNCRYLKKSSFHPRIFYGNYLAWVCAFVMIGLQMLITYVPGLNGFFSMDPMTGEAWGITILFAVLSFLIVELEKYLSTPLGPYTKPIIERCNRACCGWRYSRIKCRCCEEIDYEPHEAPKLKEHLAPKLKQGASLRLNPGDLGLSEV